MKRIITLCTAAVLCLSLLSACGGNSGDKGPAAGDVDLAAFAQEVQEKHEFSGFLERVNPEDEEMGELMAQMLDSYYPGLTDVKLKQMEIYMSMISFSSGELALVEVADDKDVATVQDIFQARIDAKSEDGPGNYPEEVEMWQRDAQVAVNGRLVMLVCHEDADNIVSEFNAVRF